MRWLRFAVLGVCFLAARVVAAGAENASPRGSESPRASASPRVFEETRIPHLDGSGRGTLVEIEPSVPGAGNFVRAKASPVPRPGELVVPAKAVPSPSPAADVRR